MIMQSIMHCVGTKQSSNSKTYKAYNNFLCYWQISLDKFEASKHNAQIIFSTSGKFLQMILTSIINTLPIVCFNKRNAHCNFQCYWQIPLDELDLTKHNAHFNKHNAHSKFLFCWQIFMDEFDWYKVTRNSQRNLTRIVPRGCLYDHVVCNALC